MRAFVRSADLLALLLAATILAAPHAAAQDLSVSPDPLDDLRGPDLDAADPDPLGDIIDKSSQSAGDAQNADGDQAAQTDRPAPVDGLRPTVGAVSPVTISARPVAPASIAEGPVPGAPPPPPDREAADRADYEPTGLRLGGLRLDTSATSGLGWSSDSGGFWFSEGELKLQTDWERHALGLRLRGGAERSFDDGDSLDPVIDAGLDGRLDLTETDRLAGGLAYTFQREDADSVESAGGRSDVHTLSATLGYQRRAGLIGLDLTGGVDRTLYSESTDRDSTLLSGALRLTLDDGGALKPFVEAGTWLRLPDDDVDGGGYRRRSVGAELKGGLAIDTGLVEGEIALGVGGEDFDDSRLGSIRTFVGDASLAWTPSELVTVGLRGSTEIEPSSIAGASGSVTHTVDAAFSYALLPNIVLDAGAGLTYQDYTGINRRVLTTRLGAGARWRFNPTVELALTVDHEITDESGIGAADSRETTVRAALTLQR